MTLSIIIPTHKRAFQVQQLLGSIAQQDFPKENLQLLLISNLRDKRLREQAPYWENIFFDFKYLEVGQKGVNKARNMGIRFARGDILYFLDDDCLLENKKHLSWLVSEHKIKSDIGIGGAYKTRGQSHGLKKFYQENTEQWIRDSIFKEQTGSFEQDLEKQSRNFEEDSKKQKGQIVEPSEKQTEQLLGGNSSYKREVFDKGFYFDPSIIFGGSEKGFNQSLREQGWTLLFMDKLSVTHNLKLDLTDFIKKSFKQGQGSIKTQSKKEHSSLKGEWAFLHKDNHSFYSFLYNLFFKIGFFWEIASQGKKGKVFQVFRFIFLFFKSRWLFFRDYFAKWFYGSVLLRFLGVLWYGVGWLYGKILWPFYTAVMLKPLGKLWYGLGWFYGSVLLRFLGVLWYGVGWLYGKILWPFYTAVMLKPLGKLWYGLGWFYGSVLLRFLGVLWYGVGWLYGKILWPFYTAVMLKPLGKLWYGLGWFYGSVLLRFLGVLWYGVGWLYGKILWPFYTAVMLKPLGKLWYGLGWFYGSVLLFLFHHSPPMKIYYFSKYQYYKRIKPLLNKNKLRN